MQTLKDTTQVKKLKIYYLSWNLAGFIPDLENLQDCHKLVDSLFKKMENPDIIVFNLQELIELKPNAEVVMGMLSDEIDNFKVWYNFVKLYFLMSYDNYVCLEHQNLLGLGMFVMANRKIYHKIKDIHVEKIKFGFMNAMPNKGSILVSVKVYDSVFVFANTHLPSGQSNKKIKERSDKVKEILNCTQKNEKFEYDIMFIAGDLNLRAYGNFPFNFEYLSQIKAAVGSGQKSLMEEYQNTDEVKKGLHTYLGVLFKEGDLPILPTYKVKKGSKEPQYKKNRRPSWTDRIFFHIKNKECGIENTKTDSFYIPQSDHL